MATIPATPGKANLDGQNTAGLIIGASGSDTRFGAADNDTTRTGGSILGGRGNNAL